LKKIRIALCDDIKYICDYFEECLAKEDDFEVVGSAYDSQTCLKLCAKIKPDILLLDIQMEEMDSGILLVPKIKKLSPSTKIIMNTIHEEDEFVIRIFEAGADNYIIKTQPIEELKKTIREIYNNHIVLDSNISKVIIREFRQAKAKQLSLLNAVIILSKLSNSELDILYDLCMGKTYSEIAAERYVEDVTVRSQSARIMKKIGVTKIDQLIKALEELNVAEAFKLFGKGNNE
jgi:DNA-binding NarL/FixJ family response regulator